MKRIMLAGLAAFLLGTAAFAQPAEARCWWNGYSWHCWHPHAWWWHHHRPYWHHYGWGHGPYWRHYGWGYGPYWHHAWYP